MTVSPYMQDPQAIFEKLRRVDPTYYTKDLCQDIAVKLDRIAELKQKHNAVILAHNYQRPEIFEIADFVGDSLGLSLQAGDVTDADVIIFCGVHFMAETAKVVSPNKKVILPNLEAGCSLADTADEINLKDRIDELKAEDPDLGVVCYVNTTAAVKALCDSCCTSSNAIEVTRAMPNRRILFVPDQNLARHVADNVPEKEIIPWDGYCYVHQELEPVNIEEIKRQYPHIKVMVHPECRDDVIRLADEVSSTSGMVEYAKQSDAMQFLAVTECGLSDLLTIEVPDKEFFRACKICSFMKMITSEETLRSLEELEPEIILPEDVRCGAERSIRRMFELTIPDKMPVALAL